MTIQAHLPHLSTPQATVLALWSLGMVLARSGALTAVSAFLATWLGRKEPVGRQQLRAFCYEATARRGTARQELVVETCFVPLLGWVVDQWEGTQLALALDATTLGTRFTVLALSVVYRGCALPVAWTVLAATAKHAWRRECWRLLRQVRRAIPRSRTVIVLADRGLYARWLVRRINTGGTFWPKGHVRGVALKTWVPQPGMAWQGTGLAFKGCHRLGDCEAVRSLPVPTLVAWNRAPQVSARRGPPRQEVLGTPLPRIDALFPRRHLPRGVVVWHGRQHGNIRGGSRCGQDIGDEMGRRGITGCGDMPRVTGPFRRALGELISSGAGGKSSAWRPRTGGSAGLA